MALTKAGSYSLQVHGVRWSPWQKSLVSLADQGFSLDFLSCVVCIPWEYLQSSQPPVLFLGSNPQSLNLSIQPLLTSAGMQTASLAGKCWLALISVLNSLQFAFYVYSALFSKEGVLIWRIKDICGSDITESPQSSVSQKAASWTFWMERFLIVGGIPLHCRLLNCILASTY